MSIQATLSSDGVEEVYTAPSLKEMCLYKCLTNKKILTKEVGVDEEMDGSEKLDWEKFRLKEPIQSELVEALLDAGEKYLFMLPPKYEPVLAAIRMSQPEHLVKVHVNNTVTLKDRQLEFLFSGGSVKSLDINGCFSLRKGSLDAINKFGNKLEYLRIGNSRVLPSPETFDENSAILRTPNLRTFIVNGGNNDGFEIENPKMTIYMRCLLQEFIGNLEDLQISHMGEFQNLDFLEPATSKLTSLSFHDCVVTKNVTAWASLFKLEELRFLDVVRSSIEEAFVGENVVQRLLTAMPNLTRLTVDSISVKDITSIRRQGSLAKQLKFLGIMKFCYHDEGMIEVDLRTEAAKLLAPEVAYFGSFEGELRILEYYSNRLNYAEADSTLEYMLAGLNDVMPGEMVAVISLLLKAFKNNGVDVAIPSLFFTHLKPLFTPAIWAKLGEVLQDQTIAAIFVYMDRVSVEEDAQPEPEMINDVVDIMTNLREELSVDHYLTLVPMVMSIAERTMTKSVLRGIGMKDFKDLLRKIAQLLENAVNRFPGETNALWGISSVRVIIKNLKDIIVSAKLDRYDLMEIFSSIIASLGNLCLNSGACRAAFHSVEGINIVMEWLTEIIDGYLGLGDRDSFALLVEILKSILQDTKLNLLDSGMIASRLEKLLFSLHSKWVFWKSSSVRDTMYYIQFESMANLLKILENDPRYDYEASADVKKILTKVK